MATTPQEAYLGIDEIQRLRLIRGADDKTVPVDPRKNGVPDDEWTRPLRLGEEVYISSNKGLTRLRQGETVSIEPGEFALMLTEEKVVLPADIVGFISVRFTFKSRGLMNISGFHVDPLYEGKLLYSVYNAGPNPVVVKRGDKIFMIVFSRTRRQMTRPSKRFDSIPSEFINNVRGPPLSLPKMNARLERLDNTVKVLIGLVTTLTGALVVALLAFFLRKTP